MKIANKMLLCATLLIILSRGALGGPALDEILNVMWLDQTAPHRDPTSTVSISRSKPVGVSFTTGPKATKLCRIAIAWGPKDDSWSPNENLVLTLWDSETKRTKIAEYAMPFKFRAWEGGTIMFPLWVAVKPNTRYYFELTVSGGDGTINGIYLSKTGCPGCITYIGNRPQDRSIWFETHAKGAFNRDAAYAEEFANWDLDQPGFERVKAAVAAKDWDTACKELVAWYERQEQFLPTAARTPKPNPDYDLKLADLAAQQQWIDLDGNIVDIGPDWNYYAWWEKRGGVGLTRTGLMQPLAGGYRNTGNEKYAKAYNDMILAMCRDQPSPLKSGLVKPDAVDIPPTFNTGIAGGSMWSALSIGPRANQALYWYSWFVNSPSFTLDARCAVLFSMADMINVLAKMKGGGNWETQIKSSLFGFANEHREFVKWREWFDRGKDGLFENLKQAIQPDGSLQESSPNYHALSVNRFLSVLETCKQIQTNVPEWAKSLTERGLDWLMYCTQGNGIIPAWGDTWQPMTCNLFARAYAYYGRDDYKWMATRGAEGHEPAEKSKAFPNGGWFVMRSGWSHEDLFLMTHNGPFPGHGHNDRLAVVAYAYGNELIIDPGIYSYGTAEAAELSKSRNHSTVTVDGRDTIKNYSDNRMIITNGFDYYAGTNSGYIGDEKTHHTRQIMFVKPSYWLLRDTITGSGKHEIVSQFQFPRCQVEIDGLTARSPNVQISLIGDGGFRAFKDSGMICLNEQLYPIPVARYSKVGELPTSFLTLIFPYPPGRMIDAHVQEIKLDKNPLICSGAIVNVDNRSDCIIFSTPGITVSAIKEQIAFEGEALVVRGVEQPESIFLANGKSVSVGGKQLVRSDKISSISVKWANETMYIDVRDPDPTLRVYTGKAKHCYVNGGIAKPVTPDSYMTPSQLD